MSVRLSWSSDAAELIGTRPFDAAQGDSGTEMKFITPRYRDVRPEQGVEDDKSILDQSIGLAAEAASRPPTAR